LDCFLDCLSKSCIDDLDTPDEPNLSFELNKADVESHDAILDIFDDIEFDVFVMSNLWIADVLPATLDTPPLTPPPSPP
jgi:hypothetical protein